MSEEKKSEAPKSVIINKDELQKVDGGSAGWVNGLLQVGNVTGTDGADRIQGSVVFGWVGDTIDGGKGDDYIYSHGGDDMVQGGEGSDLIFAGTGNDTVNGGADNDIIYGNEGNDAINGGSGNDLLTGGDGADRFVFDGNGGDDTIDDFAPSQGDRIQLCFAKNVVFNAGIQEISYTDQSGNRSTIWLHNGHFSGADMQNAIVDQFGNPVAITCING